MSRHDGGEPLYTKPQFLKIAVIIVPYAGLVEET